MSCCHLPAGVATIDDNVRTSGVGTGIANKVDVGRLELFGVAVATHGNHALPEVLDVGGDKIRKAGVNVTGRDAVNAGKVAPLIGERAGHVDAAGLGNVVRCLFLGVIGDVTRHGGGDNE